jgi:hypothetical protein
MHVDNRFIMVRQIAIQSNKTQLSGPSGSAALPDGGRQLHIHALILTMTPRKSLNFCQTGAPEERACRDETRR